MRPGDVVGTLRLLVLLLLSVVLMVLDHRGGWLSAVRQQSEVAMQPLWWLASLPGRTGQQMRESAVSREQLIEDNRRLRNALLISAAQVARLQAAAAETTRMRALLDAAQGGQIDVQLVPILDIDMDPTRQRLMLGAGSTQGVREGQPVMDGGGVLGQVISTTPTTATVLLLTDPDHVIPVNAARTGMRLLARGVGRSDVLEVANIPLSADVQVGDELVTSELGGRFPAGFAVGVVRALKPDDSRAFLIAEVTPAAEFDRGREVLLLRNIAIPAPVLEADASQAAPSDEATDESSDPQAAQPSSEATP